MHSSNQARKNPLPFTDPSGIPIGQTQSGILHSFRRGGAIYQETSIHELKEETFSTLRIYIIIPAHNEGRLLEEALQSLVNQSRLPEKLVLVNDHSTDNTGSIMNDFADRYEWIGMIDRKSSADHLPGSKVIEAFNEGLASVDEDFDIICKFDADIVFPRNYLERISDEFESDSSIGIAGGIPYIEVNGEWKFENIASRDHVRGPVKAYRKACFEAIGGLRSAVGWDTLDVLLAEYHGWQVRTLKDLHVKHLKPTGKSYRKSTKLLQGQALYRMRYGLLLSFIALTKSSFQRKQLSFLHNGLYGYLKARSEKQEFLVNKEEGQFIRSLRWKNIRLKLNPFRKKN